MLSTCRTIAVFHKEKLTSQRFFISIFDNMWFYPGKQIQIYKSLYICICKFLKKTLYFHICILHFTYVSNYVSNLIYCWPKTLKPCYNENYCLIVDCTGLIFNFDKTIYLFFQSPKYPKTFLGEFETLSYHQPRQFTNLVIVCKYTYIYLSTPVS